MIIYDYKDLIISKELKYQILDASKCFVYEILEIINMPNPIIIKIKLRRDNNINNKEKLDNNFDELIKLLIKNQKDEKRKKDKSLIISLMIGIIGALIFGSGLSIIMELATSFWLYALGILLGIIGIIIMVINEPIYKKILEKSLDKYEPIIKENNNKINELLEEANNLLIESI